MSEHLCTCGTVMFYDQENDQHVCFPCAHKEAVRLHEVEVARDAIVEAADKWRTTIADCDENDDIGECIWLVQDRYEAARAVVTAVDHWRKLKGGA